jgi:hypothetical protein
MEEVMMTIHHRRPVKLGGLSDQRNLSRIPESKHRAWHLLFGHMNPYTIAKTINDVFLDPDFEFVVQRKSDRRYVEEGLP